MISDAALLWVVGGNAFVLARAATAADLRAALNLVPSITYAGYSAGACVTSIDLQGIDAMDDATELPSCYTHDMAVDTLNLTGVRVIPHAGSPEANAAAQLLNRRALSFTWLRDGQDALYESWDELNGETEQ